MAVWLLRAALWACLALGSIGCEKVPKQRFVTHQLARGPMTDTISATGEITARQRVNIGSQVSGTIAKVLVDFNDAVRAGDVLAEIAPKVYAAQAARAAANLAVAEADRERAHIEWRDAQRTQSRHTTLAHNEMVATAELDKTSAVRDAARANVKKAEATVLQAQANRDEAMANVALTEIRSPIDGVVLDRAVEVGQTVAAQFQVATLFVVVGDMAHVHVVVNIDEADIGDITPGMPVTFHVDAYPQTTFEGTLKSLRQAPTGLSQAAPNTTGVVTYAAIIEAPNPDRLLLQGMTAQAAIQKAHTAAGLRLPLAALRFAPDAAEPQSSKASHLSDAMPTVAASKGASGVVWRLTGEAPERRDVKLGISDGRFVDVLAGLDEGDVVIVGQTGLPKAPADKGLRRVRH